MQSEIGDDAFRNWLRPMTLERVDDGHATLAAPTRFLRDWVATHYLDRILALWRGGEGGPGPGPVVGGKAPPHRNDEHPPRHQGEKGKNSLPPPPPPTASPPHNVHAKAPRFSLG